MNRGKNSANWKDGTYNPPNPQLYIYYLEGKVRIFNGDPGGCFLGNWEEEGYSFLFFSKSSDAFVQKLIENNHDLKLLDQYQMSYEQWQGGKFSSFQTGRFLIIPPWESKSSCGVESGLHEILLDPGIVFGNGLHATTRDCLEALAWLFSFQPVDSALDMGCGTGILSLAACKLGCKRCLAIDFNLLACHTTIRNVRLNDLDSNIMVIQARAENHVNSSAELIMANIHYDIMKKILEIKDFFNKRWFILSGLLKSQASDIAHQLNRPGISILKRWERDGVWHTFLGKVD